MSEDNIYNQMRRDFQERFYKKIVPQLKVFEKDRLTQLAYIKKVWIGLMVIGVVIFFLTTFSPVLFTFNTLGINFGFINILFLFFILLIIGCFYSHIMKKVYEKKIKLKIMGIVCKAIGNIKWIPVTSLDTLDYSMDPKGMERVLNQVEILEVDPDNIFIKSNLIPPYDTIIPDDVFKGCYKGVNYDIMEVCCINGSYDKKTIAFLSSINSNSASPKQSVFSGVVIKLPMNKKFTGNTLITTNSILHKSISKKLSRVIMEDVIFEKSYDVFSDNQVESRYLITPTFIERLNNIQLAFNTNKISCAFYDEYLLIGLQTNNDLFSIGNLSKPANDSKQFFIMFEEVLSIIKLIDHFKLDQKTGL